jgi:5-methylcytosine-specific restriction endonuclease McrA
MTNPKNLPYEQRLNTEAYRMARMRALVRDNFTCKYPGCQCGRLHLLTIHHLVEREKGGTHALENLLTLCEDHHRQVHATENGPEEFRLMLQEALAEGQD